MDNPIRQAIPADVQAIARLVRDAYTIYIARIGKPPGPMLDDYAARVAEQTVWLTGRDGDLAGLIVLLPKVDHLLLDNIAVAVSRQGQGIGRALIAFAEAAARARGVAELRLYTHQAMHENIALYARTGWTETGRHRQDGFDRVFFRKPV